MQNMTTGHLPPTPHHQADRQPPRVSSARTVRRWISDGPLTAHRIGPRLIRVDRESILKLAAPIGGGAA